MDEWIVFFQALALAALAIALVADSPSAQHPHNKEQQS